jgi:hypothetical protein
MLRRAPLGLQENLYPSGLSEHSGAGRPEVKTQVTYGFKSLKFIWDPCV